MITNDYACYPHSHTFNPFHVDALSRRKVWYFQKFDQKVTFQIVFIAFKFVIQKLVKMNINKYNIGPVVLDIGYDTFENYVNIFTQVDNQNDHADSTHSQRTWHATNINTAATTQIQFPQKHRTLKSTLHPQRRVTMHKRATYVIWCGHHCYSNFICNTLKADITMFTLWIATQV